MDDDEVMADDEENDPEQDDTLSIWEQTVQVIAAQMAERHQPPN